MENNNEFWREKLTSSDSALLLMVANLTESECQAKNGGDSYFFEASYAGHEDPAWVIMLWDAIVGRSGERLKEIRDDADKKCLFVRIAFAAKDEDAGMYPYRIGEPDLDAGDLWCPKLREVRAVKVAKENLKKLMKFCGSGQFAQTRGGQNIFEYYNRQGRLQQVPEGWYLAFVDGEFEPATAEVFEQNWEPK